MMKDSRNIKAYRIPTILLVGVLLFLLSFPLEVDAKKRDDVFLSAKLSNKSPYQGEAVVLSFYLYSKVGDIKYARRNGDSVLVGGSESFISKIQTDSRGKKEVIDGETFFVFPLESYVLSVDKKGSYAYKGGSFNVGVNYPVIYEDPFWGKRRGYRTEKKELEIPSVEFKVRQLPTSSGNNVDVNAVGVFSISTSVPPGDIILDKPARALITLKGRGILDDDILPQYTDAFSGKDIRLKSMSENRSVYFDGESIVTELTLDCEFIPLEREVEIGSVMFKFFNPVRGKFEETKSAPVKIKVHSITSKVPTTDI